jgi:ABC-type lipoprotein release transport system permease subunit
MLQDFRFALRLFGTHVGALLAVVPPARRAAKTDPAGVLRG